MAIGLQEFPGLFAKRLIANYSDSKTPNQGLAMFFPKVTTPDKAVMISVERSRQLVAVDVMRCTDPHRNTFSTEVLKMFIPPFYHELVDFTACQAYDTSIGRGMVPNPNQVGILMTDVMRQIDTVKNTIIRAIEKQRASVLQTGTVTIKNGDSIDYHRLAASMPVLTGANTWVSANLATANPLGDLVTGATFLRQQGLSSGNRINVIMGDTAMANFQKFSAVQTERQIFSNFRKADIGMPEYNDVSGLTFIGRVGSADFVFDLWTYADFYEDAATGVKTNYIDPNNVIMIANDFVGKTAFGGIPAVIDYEGNRSIQPVETDFLVYDTVDQVKVAWDWNIKSAPLVVPVSIDLIYTIKTA